MAPVQPLYMPPMDLGPGMPPMELGSRMPAPMGYKPPAMPEHKSIYMIFADNLIIAILVVAAATAVKMVSKWLNEEGRRKDLEKEQLKTELALLRNQVSPHFFMNTLNNIHALVDINTETAKNAIIQLSTLMRYLLYDTVKGKTTLKKEIDFIESYISLMELRYSNEVTITLDLPQQIPDIEIHPMLFVSFLENAFKHGVSYQSASYVKCKLEFQDEHLLFSISNSKHKVKDSFDRSYSGIGLTNIRKSLDLLYDKEYLLNITDTIKEFEVQLTLPAYATKMFGH
jgi:LytS/YehU family sensor histidine kinase